MDNQEIQEKIKHLKKEKKAVILAHNYQIMEIQHMADYRGDSLELARIASKLENEMIVFCGVRFMAETAKLLNPKAKVLLPVREAGCPMADMATGDDLRKFKTGFSHPWVICYVNSSIEVKAVSDICCTSGNALDIVKSAPAGKDVIFVPDRNLGSYAAEKTGRDLILWEGFCNVHERIRVEHVHRARSQYPGYKLIVHPECNPAVLKEADFAASTKGMADYVKEHDKVIIGTETGLYYQLKEKYPEKKLAYLYKEAVCINMKKTGLKDLLSSLENEEYEIIIPPETADPALKSVERMLMNK